MERDIEDIRKKIEGFMEKYNCTVEVKTTFYGWTVDGKLAVPKAKILINS